MAKKNEQYEAMFLFPASAAAEVEGSIKTARGIIERHGGKVLVIKKWDERKLAYEMGKNKRGLYIIAYYSGPGASVSQIERDVHLSEDIIRVLVTKADHLNETEMAAVEPQPIQPREERSWDRGFGSFGGGFDDRPARKPRAEAEPAGKE
jgi:small subunit ribosomal protein S6